MVTRKKPKIVTFSIFSFSMCHIFVYNQGRQKFEVSQHASSHKAISYYSV